MGAHNQWFMSLDRYISNCIPYRLKESILRAVCLYLLSYFWLDLLMLRSGQAAVPKPDPAISRAGIKAFRSKPKIDAENLNSKNQSEWHSCRTGSPLTLVL